jgi:hypothetical protein
LRAYSYLRRIDSTDNTTWWREAMRIRRDFPWLTYGETLDLTIKSIVRRGRLGRDEGEQGDFWGGVGASNLTDPDEVSD